MHKEFIELTKDPLDGVQISQLPCKDQKWEVVYHGAEQTPYENGTFQLVIQFGIDYPIRQPRVSFKTRIYHPNVNTKGIIFCGITAHDWLNSIDCTKELIDAIVELLKTPDSECFVSAELVALYHFDKNTFDENARKETKQFAM